MTRSSQTLQAKLATAVRALAVLAVGLLVACQSSVQVRHQDALGAEAGAYASYEILDHPVGRAGAADPLIEQVIHDQMKAKGYQRTARNEADLLVSYKVLLGEEPSASPSGPPDDGLNGEATYSWAQPVWDVVARDDFDGPQPGEKDGIWPHPGPSPVFDSIPNIDVSKLSKQSQSKTLMVMLQEPTTMRVLWLGWSTSEVDPAELAPEARAAAGVVMSRVPAATSRAVID